LRSTRRRRRGNGRSSRCCRFRRGRGRYWGFRRNRRWGRTRRRRSRGCFLLLCNRPQHVSRPRDVRQIDLGPDFFFAAQWARGARGRRLRFSRAAKVDSYLVRLMLLDRAGMCLLLGHSDLR
jgi:hypothetical protein